MEVRKLDALAFGAAELVAQHHGHLLYIVVGDGQVA